MHFKRRRDQAVLWLPAIFPLGAICIVNMCTCIALSLAYNIHLGWKWHSRSSACRMIWVLAEQRVKSRMACPAVTSGLFSLAGTCFPDAFCQYSSSPPTWTLLTLHTSHLILQIHLKHFSYRLVSHVQFMISIKLSVHLIWLIAVDWLVKSFSTWCQDPLSIQTRRKKSALGPGDLLAVYQWPHQIC